MTTKREPSADLVKATNAMREWFEALMISGFTESQALAIIGTAIGTMAKPSDEAGGGR